MIKVLRKLKKKIPFSQKKIKLASLLVSLLRVSPSWSSRLRHFFSRCFLFSSRSISGSPKSLSQRPSCGFLFLPLKNFTFSPMLVRVFKNLMWSPSLVWSPFSKSLVAVQLSKTSLLVAVGISNGSPPHPKFLNGRDLFLRLIGKSN